MNNFHPLTRPRPRTLLQVFTKVEVAWRRLARVNGTLEVPA